MHILADSVASVIIVLAALALNALVGVLAHKLSKLYDHQSNLRGLDILVFALGAGWVMLVIVLVMLLSFRKNGLHWHKAGKVREVPWRDATNDKPEATPSEGSAGQDGTDGPTTIHWPTGRKR